MKILEIDECVKCKKQVVFKIKEDGTRYCTEHEKNHATDAPHGEKLRVTHHLKL